MSCIQAQDEMPVEMPNVSFGGGGGAASEPNSHWGTLKVLCSAPDPTVPPFLKRSRIATPFPRAARRTRVGGRFVAACKPFSEAVGLWQEARPENTQSGGGSFMGRLPVVAWRGASRPFARS